MFQKQRLTIGLSLILLLSTVLAACSPVSQPAPNRVDSTPTVNSQPTTVMPSATPPAADQPAPQEYINENFGFSLSIPEGYEVENSIYYSFVFRAPQGTQGHRERAFLQVELALDQTAEWYANQAKAENSYLGIEIPVSEIEIDGQKAYILGQMPGQDINRQVFVVNKGLLYHLTFMPDSPGEGEAYQQMVSLYASILDTLTFLPERLEVPPVLSMSNIINQLERAFEARSVDDYVRPLGDEFLVVEWLNPGTSAARYNSITAAPVITNSLAQSPDLTFQSSMGWPNVVGGVEQFTGYFPNEDITSVLVQGWGPQGNDEAVIIIARRSDGSLYWRGVLVSQGKFVQ